MVHQQIISALWTGMSSANDCEMKQMGFLVIVIPPFLWYP